MTEQLQAHRQLLDAAKLLLFRFEEKCEMYHHGPLHDDWPHITRCLRAIAESKEALEIGSSARRGIHELERSA